VLGRVGCVRWTSNRASALDHTFHGFFGLTDLVPWADGARRQTYQAVREALLGRPGLTGRP